MRTRAHKILTAITFLSVLAAMGCGTYSPVAPTDDTAPPGVENPQFVRLSPASSGSDRTPLGSPEAIVTKVISAADGGTIANEYFSLYFPPGALEEDTEISIEMPQYPYAVARFGPHGISFNENVILSFPIDVIESEEVSGKVLWYNEDSRYWEYIGGYTEDESLKVELEHFSEYGIQGGDG